jgi:hypothetical protein
MPTGWDSHKVPVQMCSYSPHAKEVTAICHVGSAACIISTSWDQTILMHDDGFVVRPPPLASPLLAPLLLTPSNCPCAHAARAARSCGGRLFRSKCAAGASARQWLLLAGWAAAPPHTRARQRHNL